MIGDALRQTFSRYGKCFRVGGDEFCVILEQRYDEVDVLMQNFAREMEKRRDQEPRLPRVSAGSACFDTAQKNIHDAIREADAEMYTAKSEGREDPVTGAYMRY